MKYTLDRTVCNSHLTLISMLARPKLTKVVKQPQDNLALYQVLALHHILPLTTETI